MSADHGNGGGRNIGADGGLSRNTGADGGAGRGAGSLAGRLAETIETPMVTIDLDILDSNLRAMAGRAAAAGVKLRPHAKTHKSVWIAKEQLRYGAAGITVAKLGEAEVMAEAGIRDILVAFPIVGETKLMRLARLLQKADITVSVDHPDAARGLSELGESLGRPIPIYVDVNSGLNRCGREPGGPSAELVQELAGMPGIKVTGLMTHAGHAYGSRTEEEALAVARQEADALLSTYEVLRARGFGPLEISVGSTPTAKFAGALQGVTEMRPGAYVYNDVSQWMTHTATLNDCAMRIYATVVSLPRPNTAIIDAGSKTLTSDSIADRPGYGLIPARPDIVIERLSEEHGILRVPDDCELRIGDVVEIVPNHCCTVANLHDGLLGMRGGRAERVIAVDARGRVR